MKIMRPSHSYLSTASREAECQQPCSVCLLCDKAWSEALLKAQIEHAPGKSSYFMYALKQVPHLREAAER